MARIAKEAGERLRELRDRVGLSRPQLAAKIKAHPNQIQKLENGERKLTVEWIEKLAPHLGVEPRDFLRAAEGRLHASVETVKGTEFARLPLFDIRASAGRGALVADGEPIGFRLFDHNWLKTLTRSALGQLAVIQVSGDSMWDTLHDGDHVLVDLGRKALAQPGIFVLQLQEELIVKRVSMDFSTRAVTLVSDNKVYPAQTITEPGALEVVGRVVWLGRACG